MKCTVALLLVVGIACAASLQKTDREREVVGQGREVRKLAGDHREVKEFAGEHREFRELAKKQSDLKEPVRVSLSLKEAQYLVNKLQFRPIRLCEETCTNGGDPYSCCQAHGYPKGGHCNENNQVFCDE
ncbi:unnamed protein product [Bursaphelenchus okinawaensis]|uniref:Uncharacterized protein n=1 Tax=Bursaphelenchus okinawaensis TaxID=465554 RepID=A0A811JW56_9BILA|nr:unnamed protein product [Bursaphelenchus okinawaensis]CAG9086069.1 unnamed protein product [Bursaphelenchus okinawaensis]